MYSRRLQISLAFFFLFFGTNQTLAQVTTTTNQLLLIDASGNGIRLSIPGSGLSGIQEWTLPAPPLGITSGFVQAGTATLTSLQWNNTSGYWEAVAGGGGGGVGGSGTDNFLPKWTSGGTSLTNSLVSDNGTYVSIANAPLALTGTTGATPVSGAGTRMMWVPAKKAFRAGMVTGTHWDAGSIGEFSIASGLNSIASGTGSVALGYNATASDDAATAMGNFTTASGYSSLAVGNNTTASADHSSALGWFATAEGNTSMAVGYLVEASGDFSVAMGRSTTASGLQSTALGSYVSTSSHAGSFIYGDNSTTTVLNNTAADEFMVRSTGGFQLITTLASTSPDFGITNGAILANGTTGGTPADGAGTRMMWIPAKKAFRAGEALGTEWDDAEIGAWSTAFGVGTTASGQGTFAVGFNATASGNLSVAIGETSEASGIQSVVIGSGNLASNTYAIAMGRTTVASGGSALALGNTTEASGDYSTAMGSFVSTDLHTGSFIYGDNSASFLSNTADHQFMVRAVGGTVFFTGETIFYTDGTTASTGVSVPAGGNSWVSVSDSNRKENRLNMSGEDVLNKLSNIWVGSWNYKTQDPSLYRHYGPMAQEFFAAFGSDGVGTIGNDTTLATADVDGVTLMAVKALIERTNKLEAENTTLRQQVDMLMRERAEK